MKKHHFPCWLFSKKESVLVKSEEELKALGEGFHDSPVSAKSEFEYEGKEHEKVKAAKESKEKDKA